MNSLNQIDSILSLGRIFTGKKRVCLILGVIVSLLLPLATIGIIISISLNAMEYDSGILITLILANLFSLTLFGILLYISIINIKNIAKAKIYLQDAVMVSASARRLDLEEIKYKPYQIEVSFNFNERRIIKVSSPGNSIIGYRKYNIKYCDKNLKILYSPKNDEVMFLKT